MSRLKQIGVDSLFPLKKGMDLWEDAKALHDYEGGQWDSYEIPKPPPAPPPSPDRPERVAKREAKRRQTLARLRREEEKIGPNQPMHKRRRSPLGGRRRE